MADTSERPWSVAIRLDEIPEGGRHVELEASAELRAQLAKPAGVDAIERLTAVFDLSRRGRDGLHVGGHISATVRQSCVVTLEPVENAIEEDIDVDFEPPAPVLPDRQAEEDEPETAGMAADEAEPLIGNSVDLGVLATEFLILGVDPYPRKPDAAFAAPRADDATAHPFAALAGWNKKPTVKE